MKKILVTMALVAVVCSCTTGTVNVPGATPGKSITLASTTTATAPELTEAARTERLMSPGSKWETTWKFDGKQAQSIIEVKSSRTGEIYLEYSWVSLEMGQGSFSTTATILPDGRVEWGKETGYHFVLTPREDEAFDIWTQNESGVYTGTLRRKAS